MRGVTASTRAHPLFALDREPHWQTFREEMARLQHIAEQRHAAKHAAMLEAERGVPIIVALPAKSEDK